MKLKAVIAENFKWKPIKHISYFTSWKTFNSLLGSVMKAIANVSFLMIYIIISYGVGI